MNDTVTHGNEAMKHYSPVAPDFTQELGLVLTCTSVRLRLKDRQAIAQAENVEGRTGEGTAPRTTGAQQAQSCPPFESLEGQITGIVSGGLGVG